MSILFAVVSGNGPDGLMYPAGARLDERYADHQGWLDDLMATGGAAITSNKDEIATPPRTPGPPDRKSGPEVIDGSATLTRKREVKP